MTIQTPDISRSTSMAQEQTGCRLCGKLLKHSFVDLGMSPPCESFITADRLDRMEPYYPLYALVCDHCYLVQLKEYFSPAEIFTEYAYFSSFATSWVSHAKTYCDEITERLDLNENSFVVEIASNDGYLLQHFLPKGIPILGIEPAVNVAETAIAKGVPTRVDFFGSTLAAELVGAGRKADLVIGNNVLAQVPDLNDFVRGLQLLLKPEGVITLEFPHLANLIEQNQFDTIYHEHFSYFSFVCVEQVFARHGLTLFDVEQLPTHGGSLRIFARHADAREPAVSERVSMLRAQEVDDGFLTLDRYLGFDEQVRRTKRALLSFLIDAKERGKRIVGYGAPGKGNTLLNYCGIRTDFLDFTVDANPYKQGKYTPGTRIPILAPEAIREARPDYVLILPWNLRDEISRAASFVRGWGGKFVTPIPHVQVF